MKVILRTTSNQAGKHRPEWFSYESCFRSLYNQDPGLTVFFDGAPETVPEYISKTDVTTVFCENGGSETKSFRSLLTFLQKQAWPNNEIVYIVEDDYLHRPEALKILQEAFDETNADYITLYDHPDKYIPGYFDKYAPGFSHILFFSRSCHWKTIPSTTNTFATRYKTLMDDMEVHMKFSPEDEKTSRDHEKFHALWTLRDRNVVSSMPGFSSHTEMMLMSPCFDWAGLSSDSSLSNSSLLSKASALSVDPLDDPVPDTNA